MQAQLSALDDQFQAKLMAEQERYDELLRKKEALNDQWDEQNKQLLARHEQLLEEVTAECNARVQVRWPCDTSQAILNLPAPQHALSLGHPLRLCVHSSDLRETCKPNGELLGNVVSDMCLPHASSLDGLFLALPG